MVHLDQQDLQRLVKILQQFSEFEDEKSRRSFLPLVGLGPLLPRMDLAGTPLIASMKMINFLEAYGRLPNGVEALGSLLAGIRTYLGITEQSIVDDITAKYQLTSSAVQAGRTGADDPTWPAAGRQDSSPHQAVPHATRTRKVLISYSSADRQWLEMVKTHLALLERQHSIELWDDTRVAAGAHEEQAMNKAFDAAEVALLLVSANFLASKMIMDRELPRILARRAQGHMAVLSLILSPCLYRESPLGAYRTFNAMNQPLSRLTPAQVDEVLVNLARELQQSI